MNKPIVIFLMGPTACGKTNLSLELAKRLPIEIISVDSAQIYIGMDLGTSKPDPSQLAMVTHHLINICLPSDHYSVAQFCQAAHKLIFEIHKRGNIPVLVGGTMLYFYALRFGLADLPAADHAMRQDLLEQANKYGWPYLHEQLNKLDPDFAKTIAIYDKQRIQRGLEVCLVTGNKFSELLALNTKDPIIDLSLWDIKYFALLYEDRKILHQNIADRFFIMMQQGFLQEVETLLNQNIPLNSSAMRCVGYRQLADYLLGKSSKEIACERAIAATRQLAKNSILGCVNGKV